MKAVAWWHDPDHDAASPTNVSNIDLYIRNASTSNNIASSADTLDNKEMAYSAAVGGNPIKLTITGTNVTADNTGCGSDSQKVYFSFLAEDCARNDADGPSWSASTCQGVEPW